MPTNVDVARLIGNATDGDTISVPIWRCDTTSDDGCLNPYGGQISTKSFRAMVIQKTNDIVDRISTRSPHGDVNQVIAFLNTTDLSVYGMLAAGTRYNNHEIADSTMGTYVDLIAAKYAEVYIRRSVKDLQEAIGRYETLADSSQA
ncbi:IncF plasmid conjugative transfer pilus assembly protein TraH [Candidatus Burkholderia pumila]|uniref:IncF plasmid conjugative transfer pilus assembly protein TraH n=1 Tax=Candidatus Burkholderia pumila TaxID=1090375 RepID=A0ABR5HPJ0_9BURK|nr:IncF plasmid conjugative transfer pilus assembly protein TraH [Candidatus Burkholderia pumila]